jgi:hypothetical protein
LASLDVLCPTPRRETVIRVQKQRQPRAFKRLVGDPGKKFLASTPKPSSADYKNHEYWRRVSRQLYDGYRKICAFSCHFIASDTGLQTVEHFKSKVAYPDKAYSWSNYRLVCGLLNGRKGEFEDVLDPFTIEDGWFVLDFPGTVVKPSGSLSTVRRRKVEATIQRLGLNHDESCIESRQYWLDAYCQFAQNDEATAFEYLSDYAPFLARELNRQGLRGTPILQQRKLTN